jgi:hypothetical protein
LFGQNLRLRGVGLMMRGGLFKNAHVVRMFAMFMPRPKAIKVDQGANPTQAENKPAIKELMQ